jgi:hypothetical protein
LGLKELKLMFCWYKAESYGSNVFIGYLGDVSVESLVLNRMKVESVFDRAIKTLNSTG